MSEIRPIGEAREGISPRTMSRYGEWPDDLDQFTRDIVHCGWRDPDGLLVDSPPLENALREHHQAIMRREQVERLDAIDALFDALPTKGERHEVLAYIARRYLELSI